MKSVSGSGEILKRIEESVVKFDVKTANLEVTKAIQGGVLPNKLLEAVAKGMEVVGNKYESGEYFVPDLILAGETAKEVIEVLKPYMGPCAGTQEGKLGTAVVATVQGDIHDIGKNIFVTLMTIAGFKVIDLGVDVPAEKISKAVNDHDAYILGLSALLTTNLEQIPVIIKRLEKDGLRDKVQIIVGGAGVAEEYSKEMGANGYAKTALGGVDICKKWARARAGR